jgi:hypothetical protein
MMSEAFAQPLTPGFSNSDTGSPGIRLLPVVVSSPSKLLFPVGSDA